MHTPTPFNEWITTQASGTANDEITAALADVTEAVNHLQKKGKVVIELQVDTAGSGHRNVEVAVKVTAKAPEPEPTPSIYFVGDHGTLHRDDPYQTRLEGVRDVDTETGEIRNVQED